ncbi:MAG: hypothetical protein FJ347_05095 [Sphingomonadales bacterium]|nr:hypothetical protein [Sphingomonadales bacterium]
MATEILSRLDAFIRKYYLHKLVRGAMLTVALLLGLFLLIAFSEYFAFFPVWTRTLLFWGYVALTGAVLWYWIAKPLMGMYRLGAVISYDEAAKIIGEHFGNVQDKLLNLLQLEAMARQHPDSALLLAGIDQKTQELKPVPFTGAINLNANRKYLKYALPPVVLLLVLMLFQSHIIFDGSKRFFQYNKHFEKQAPFSFRLMNKELSCRRGAPFNLELVFEGRSLPDEAFLTLKGQRIKMLKSGRNKFTYEISSVQEDLPFQFEAMGFSSQPYLLKLMPDPAMTDAEATVVYPAYTGKGTEKFSNTTEFQLPEGSTITWNFRARDAESLQVIRSARSEQIKEKNGVFIYRMVCAAQELVRVLPRHSKATGADTLQYRISAVADAFPEISVEKKDDSGNVRRFWFVGAASDDYAVSSVSLKYRFTESDNAGKLKAGWMNAPVKVSSGSRVDFLYGLDMDALGMAPGEAVEYYFEARDNDGIHGPKVSKTTTQPLRRQTLKEVREDADKKSDKVQQMMQQAFSQSRQMQKEAQELQQKLNNGKNMAWEEQQRVEDLLKKQQELEKKISDMKQEQQKLQQQKDEFQAQKPESMERKKQMDELLKQMENPEMKKLMEEIQKLLEQKASKDKIAEKMNEMRQMNKEQARDLNQLMEQFKELQLEQKLNDNLDRLNKLSEKQDKLAEKTKQQQGDKEGKLKEEQQKLSEEMKEIRKDLKEALDMNKGLEKPMNLDLGEQEQQQAESSQQKAGNELENGKNKKASENQKDAAEQMKKAAEKMQKSMEQEQQKRMAEDYQTLRLLLENLVETSVEQEDIFTELSTIREYNPRFVELNKRQMVVREQCALLEDSLRALAKRQPMVSTFVSKEIARINNNMDMALQGLKVRDLRAASMREQFVMTGLNNLAVMLLESMQDMQQKMSQQNQKQGKGSCSNPGGKGKSQGKPNKGDKLSKGQEQLGQMLQEMQKKGQDGKPGKDGQPKPGDGQQGKEMNEEYARIALMQEALRRKLGELRKAMEQGGNGAGAKTLRETEKLMEEQEKELVNKRFNQQLIERQKEIQTRLLEHEKSDRNQQTEEQRQANAPGNYTPTAPASIQKYMQEKRAEREAMRRPPAELTPYFRGKVNSYLQKIQ